MNSLHYNNTKFFKSYSRINDIDIKDGIEVAFIGYSNSGKSSAINALTHQKKLARCSKIPGRTQLINFFEVISSFRIVDLPGYGYSQAPLLVRRSWQRKVYHYLEQRKQLKGIVLLMDIRYPLKTLDQKIIDIALDNQINIFVLLTKCDKLTVHQRIIQFEKIYKKLSLLLKSFQMELFSSLKKIGIKQLELQLNDWYDQYFLNIKPN